MQSQFSGGRIFLAENGNGTIRSKCIKINFDQCLVPYIEINSKKLTGVKVRSVPINLPEDISSCYFLLGNDFLNMVLK